MAISLSALRNDLALLPRNIIFLLLIFIFVRRWVNPRALCGRKEKKKFTSSDLEPATFWLVALYLNNYTTVHIKQYNHMNAYINVSPTQKIFWEKYTKFANSFHKLLIYKPISVLIKHYSNQKAFSKFANNISNYLHNCVWYSEPSS
jgi:energy-coupling factor transporter transmembrane protein EcfT